MHIKLGLYRSRDREGVPSTHCHWAFLNNTTLSAGKKQAVWYNPCRNCYIAGLCPGAPQKLFSSTVTAAGSLQSHFSLMSSLTIHECGGGSSRRSPRIRFLDSSNAQHKNYLYNYKNIHLLFTSVITLTTSSFKQLNQLVLVLPSNLFLILI